jgi:type I restriction enzyme S subunit
VKVTLQPAPNWIRVRLKALASMQTGPFGSQIHNEDYVSGGMPLINPSHIRDGLLSPDPDVAVGGRAVEELKRHRLLPGDLVFARRGEMGRCALMRTSDSPCLCGTGSIRVRLHPEKAVSSFVRWALSTPHVREWLELESVGSTMDNLNTAILGRLRISMCTLGQQRSVSNFLDRKTAAIDDLIKKKERLVELLQEKRQALITQAVTKGLDPAVPMKDSGVEWLGNVPAHWKLLPLRRAISFLTDYEANGSFADTKDNVNLDKGVPYAWYVRATDLENERWGLVDSNRHCDRHSYEFLRKTKLFGGELLVAKRGEIGKVYLMPRVECPATLAPNLYLVRLNTRILPEWACTWFRSEIGGAQLVLANRSTTIGALYKDDLRDCLCLMPPAHEQQEILRCLAEQLRPIDVASIGLLSSVDLLREYRQAVITAAVTGRLDIPAEAA